MAAPVNFVNNAQDSTTLTYTWTASAIVGVTHKLYFTPTAGGSESSVTPVSGSPVSGFVAGT
jgi:hypothetical protein